MKDKKGFTLVELIVTIAIVISILAIAIISVTNVSTKQKENAYEQVKEQVIGAAEDYAISNEYIFETLGVGGSKTIPLKDLVGQDYLNVLTNPITGKRLNECNYVRVTKKNEGYGYVFIDNDKKCEPITKLVVKGKEPGDPDMMLQYEDPDGNNGWYINDILVGVIPLENNNGPIDKVFACFDENCTELTNFSLDERDRKVYNNTLSKESKKTTVRYKVTNKYGKYVTEDFTYKLDKSIKKTSIVLKPTSQTTSDITFTLSNPGDDFSGIENIKYSFDSNTWNNYSSAGTLLNYTGDRTIYAKAIDNAGNESEIVEATGYCNKDGVSVNRSSGSCDFYLSLSLPNKPSGVTSGKYEYYVWNKKATTDASNLEKTKVSSICGDRPPASATIITIDNSITNSISMLKNTKYMYYCFAVRPHRKTEINSINRWTVQYKHAMVDNVCK